MPPRSRSLKSVPGETPEKRGGLAAVVQDAVGKLTLAPEDVAVAALAEHLARTIDRAEAIAADVRKVPFDPDTADAIERLSKRVSAHATAADLVPKLQSLLAEMGATPKSRAAVKGTTPAPSAGSQRLAAMRGEGA